MTSISASTKRNRIIGSSVLIIAAIVFLLLKTCGDQSLQASVGDSSIVPPIKGVDVAFKNNEIDAEQGGTITYDNGTSIEVPANAFVDRKGVKVKGKVKINYREFHTPAEIIASGIPMTYEENGETYNFQSAGMFDINGQDAQGEDVFVAEDKQLTVNMASYRGDDDYGFYSLDENSGKWTYHQKSTPVVNEEKKSMVEALASSDTVVQPLEPHAYDENKFTFDLSIDVQKFPELKPFQAIIWQYAGNDPATDPEKNEWIFSKNWSDVKLEKSDDDENIYQLKLSNGAESFVSAVTPVFKGKSLEAAMAKFETRMAEYNERLEKRKKAQARANITGDFIRTASVNGFGIYNYDRFYHRNDVITVNARFNVKGQSVEDAKQAKIFLIMEENNEVVNYSNGYGIDKFSFFPNVTKKLIVIYNDMSVATFSPAQFDEMPLSQLKQEKGQPYTFNLTARDTEIYSVDDISTIINNM